MAGQASNVKRRALGTPNPSRSLQITYSSHSHRPRRNSFGLRSDPYGSIVKPAQNGFRSPTIWRNDGLRRRNILKVFRGFEKLRYQKHDGLILRLVKEFNRNKIAYLKQLRPSCKIKGRIPDLDPNLVKSLLMQEAGGDDAYPRDLWEYDPAHINNINDWREDKKALGLECSADMGTMTPEKSIRAAITWLAFKGTRTTEALVEKKVRNQAGRLETVLRSAYTTRFVSWEYALQRYNGNRQLVNGRPFYVIYKENIMGRLE